MPSTTMNIPEKINVGYQKRDDTYTGKLAFVVWTDAKGIIRKEKSWLGWCDAKIPKHEFKNEPTEGFVLNKGVGGQRESYGWNARNEYIRVYDPRDFEFEISVANMLFILQECSSIKGKGLEGKFVYSWNGTELVLLPCCSQEYEECVKYTTNQSTKVSKNDVIEGYTYQMRDMRNVMYLGRHSWFSLERDWSNSTYKLKPCGMKHIFLDLDSKTDQYIVEAGFTKLAKRTSDEAISSYADSYEKMKNSIHCLIPTKIIFKKKQFNKNTYSASTFIKKDDKYYSAYIYKHGYTANAIYEIKTAKEPFNLPVLKSGSIISKANIINYHSPHNEITIEKVADLQKIEFYKMCLVNEKGNSYDLIDLT